VQDDFKGPFQNYVFLLSFSGKAHKFFEVSEFEVLFALRCLKMDINDGFLYFLELFYSFLLFLNHFDCFPSFFDFFQKNITSFKNPIFHDLKFFSGESIFPTFFVFFSKNQK
jgi:hypothetical protein